MVDEPVDPATVVPARGGALAGGAAAAVGEIAGDQHQQRPLPAGPGDIPHLMLSDFATNFGNDWYVVPIDLDVGTLTVTRSLVITDSFGVQTLVAPINDPRKPATGCGTEQNVHDVKI